MEVRVEVGVYLKRFKTQFHARLSIPGHDLDTYLKRSERVPKRQTSFEKMTSEVSCP